ncbi:hypothetical protein [Comamonas odontotermitis]|uniref:hypothetical protein n=1 Tax=Comamonas odontotermitis TaxID=379895 RepID=UPI003750D5DB
MRNKIIFAAVVITSSGIYAAQPPQWCDLKIGNTYANGCDQYFNSRQEAAEYFSELRKPNIPTFEFTSSLAIQDYKGANPVNWYRNGRYLNEGYNVWVKYDVSGNIFAYCPPIEKGRRYNAGVDEAIACGGSEISINGPSLTTALPQGPSLPQKISILTGGYRPLADNAFSYELIEDGKIIFQETIKTDSNGGAFLNYVPPYFLDAKIEIKATCSECTNDALQEISVQGLPLPTSGEEPQMCSR